MSDQIDPADAARALSEIGLRREQVIRRKVFPAWFWWSHAALIIAFTAAVESGNDVLVWSSLVLFTVGSFLIDRPVSRAARAAAPHRGLARPGGVRRTLTGLAIFIGGLFGVCVGTGLSLKAAGVPYPATIAATVAAVFFATVGPLLVRWEASVLVRRSGSGG